MGGGGADHLKIKLFSRTTRSIATTEAGEQLYQRLSPLFDDIDKEINELSAFRNAVSGCLRINGNEHVFRYVLKDKLTQFMQDYPEVQLDLVMEDRFIDIVAERFDAGIRLGDDVAKDLIAVRISADLPMCAAASPDYLAQHGTPQTPYDLTEHQCLLHRLPSTGEEYGVGISRPESDRENRPHSPTRALCQQPRLLTQRLRPRRLRHSLDTARRDRPRNFRRHITPNPNRLDNAL